ncbi:MAG TPA: carboxypeptidase-like regulatory domain-containing protein [Candidatus Acidoferrum sp.]|nr:carboxypeptidase-like regulatory domain-containing protein [Candidatus Acidoferrum sp.]
MKRRQKASQTKTRSEIQPVVCGIRAGFPLTQGNMDQATRNQGFQFGVPHQVAMSNSSEGFLLLRSAVFAVFLAFLFLSLTPGAANARGYGDDNKNVELRTVHGIVVDKNENGIPSSIVYLENMKTQGVRTYIADDSGNYRFSGLDPNEDYEIHAEKGALASSTHTISSFDSRRDIEVVLHLIHKKK